MNTRLPPYELAIDLTDRSRARVQVAAVLVDENGRIFAWGWNHAGSDGLGCHAETHAILRANRDRLRGATVYVAGKYRKNNSPVMSYPCADCRNLLCKVGVTKVYYTTRMGEWSHDYLD